MICAQASIAHLVWMIRMDMDSQLFSLQGVKATLRHTTAVLDGLSIIAMDNLPVETKVLVCNKVVVTAGTSVLRFLGRQVGPPNMNFPVLQAEECQRAADALVLVG